MKEESIKERFKEEQKELKDRLDAEREQ